MDEDRRGVLKEILRQLLAPLEQRVEQMTQEYSSIKEQLDRIERQQEMILSKLK